ncbi:hypothetical protein L1049_019298 [Liquidambar formosana]|uniref:Uncharacterized protein n=1 Tax=Liquidambar formosana TaxID=63359 RepID=A0AAP0X6F3_LIQFO
MKLKAHGELLSMVNLEKDTALHNAVRHGHLEIVELLIKKDPGLTQLINDYGESPLFLAVNRKHFSIATHILEASPTCSYQGRYNMNVLHAAVIRTQRNFLSAFIQKCQTAITEADEFGWTPLHYSAYLCQPKATQLLLKYNISVAYMKDKDGMSALHIAAKEGHAIVMRELITICPQTCELLDYKGRTALHVAVESGKTSVIKYALMTRDLEGLINKQDKEGNTPLHLAAIHGHHDIANLLAGDRRVDKRAMNKEGLTSIEIISTMELRRCERAWITMKLVLAGALPSLKGVVYGDNTKTKLPQHVESKEPAEYQEKKHTALDRKGELRENEESKYHRLKDISNTHLLVATIIATVTFAAGRFEISARLKSQKLTTLDGLLFTMLQICVTRTKGAKLLMENNRDVAYMKDKEGMSSFHLAAKEGHEIAMRQIIALCPEAYELRDNYRGVL